MFSGDPIGHCYKTLAPKLKSERETKGGEERLKPLGESRIRSESEKEDDTVKGVKRDSSGAVISLTKKESDAVVSESPDQTEFDPHLSSEDKKLVGEPEPKVEDQPRVVDLQVRKHFRP